MAINSRKKCDPFEGEDPLPLVHRYAGTCIGEHAGLQTYKGRDSKSMVRHHSGHEPHYGLREQNPARGQY